MKKMMLWILTVTCLLSCFTFASCDLLRSMIQKPEDEPAYELRYSSNGDGTCYVSDIVTRVDVAEPYTLEIPEKSPDGETVVAVKPQHQLDGLPVRNVPLIILKEDFEAMCQKAKENGMDDFSYSQMNAYFLHLTLEGLSERSRAELLDTYPCVEYADVYVFDTTASSPERLLISLHLYFAGFDDAAKAQTDKNLIEATKGHLTPDELGISMHHTAMMERLVLPASVQEMILPTSVFSEVVYGGTQAQWNAGVFEINGMLGTKIVCSDGEFTYKQDYVLDHQDGRVSVNFSIDLSAPITVKIPEEMDGQTIRTVSLTISNSLPDRFVIPYDVYESLYAQLKEIGRGDDYPEGNRIQLSLGNEKSAVIMGTALAIERDLSLPKDYFRSQMVRYAKQTHTCLGLTSSSSDYFTSIELPASIQRLDLFFNEIIYEEMHWSLKHIYFQGTMAQWKEVIVYVREYNVRWSADLSLVTVHCSDGDIVLENSNIVEYN